MNKTQHLQNSVKPSNFKRSIPNDRKSKVVKKKLLNPELFVNRGQETEQSDYLSVRLIKDLPVNKSIINNLHNKSYTRATEIQDKSIEAILSGNDVMGLAQTGTGKTGAFLIPLIQMLLGKKPSFQVLIIAPTRELALQIDEEFKSIAAGLHLFSECFIGGTNVEKDVIKLRRQYHIVIGTPGRLGDMVKRNALRLANFDTLVLDEFDRLFDMGFLPDIMKIVEGIGQREQTILFSATDDKSQKSIIDRILNKPVVVKLNDTSASADNVDQEIIKVGEGENKMDVLLKLISEPSFEKVLIFADTKRWVSKISKTLRKAGIKADEIHGNKSQNYRSQVLDSFKNDKIRVLVATDVAARGLDIVNVSHVINYMHPQNMDSYIHRIGRTGRAGKTGKAYTFVD